MKGLTRATFASYFQYIQLQLEFPQVAPRNGEDWSEHLKRLQEEKTSGKSKGKGLTYNVLATLVNAADYGIPQKRERVFIVGFRDDLEIEWSFPKPTHSYDALVYDQWVTGDYWKRHGLEMPDLPDQLVSRVTKLRKNPRIHSRGKQFGMLLRICQILKQRRLRRSGIIRSRRGRELIPVIREAR